MHRTLKSWSASPASGGGRLLLRLLAVSLVVGLSLSSSVSFFSPHQAQAAALSPQMNSGNATIIFVHGLLQPPGTGWDCMKQDTWGSAIDYLSGSHDVNGQLLHWSQQDFRTIQYYNGDTHCGQSTGSPGDPNSSSYPANFTTDNGNENLHNPRYTASCGGTTSDDGTWNEDIDRLSCLFAWYLYWNFGLQGRTVEIVTHSMGGLIVRNALYQVAHNVGTWAHPPSLGNISDVITFETPHGGSDFARLCPVPSVCPSEVTEMVPGSSFMNSMAANLAQNPQIGANGTNWTLMGSDSDVFVPFDKATYMDGGHKAYYVCDQVPTVDGTMANQPWCYDHGGPLTDESDAYDAHIKFCDGCPRTPSAWNEETGIAPHSLHSMFYALWNAPRVDNVHGGGAFFDKWQQTGGVQGPLGGPITNWYTIPGGQEQDFQVGSIYWSAATGTVEVQGAIHGEYLAMQGPGGILGFPVQDEGPVAAGRVSYFAGNHCGSFNGPFGSGSAIYWSPATDAWQVGGCIYQRYLQSDLNGPNGPLGFPISDVTQLSNTYVSYFAGNAACGGGQVFFGRTSGSAIYSSSLGTYYVAGCNYHHYWDFGGPGGMLGVPTSDVLPLHGGYVSYFAGQVCGSPGPNNSGSAIYSTSATFEVQGCIYNTYWNLGGPSGILSFPVSDEGPVAAGRVSYFAGNHCGSFSGPNGSGSAIYWSPSTGAWQVGGCIYRRYLQSDLNGPSGQLGFPISNVTQLSNTYVSYFAGNACAGGGPVINGRVSGSAVYSNSLGTFYVAGCIYHNWQQSWGGPTGFLGLPISDVMPITLGSTGGYVSFFVGTNCGSGAWQGSTSAIYSSPRGTFEVHGCIYQQYRQFTDDGGNTLFFDLGFPTSNEVGVTSGFSGVAARTNSFEHGAIYWTPTSGALEVHGAIYAAYQQQFNGAAGALGLPTTNEFFNQQGQAESDFENGFITYDFSTHQTSVTVFPPVG